RPVDGDRQPTNRIPPVPWCPRNRTEPDPEGHPAIDPLLLRRGRSHPQAPSKVLVRLHLNGRIRKHPKVTNVIEAASTKHPLRPLHQQTPTVLDEHGEQFPLSSVTLAFRPAHRWPPSLLGSRSPARP